MAGEIRMAALRDNKKSTAVVRLRDVEAVVNAVVVGSGNSNNLNRFFVSQPRSRFIANRLLSRSLDSKSIGCRRDRPESRNASIGSRPRNRFTVSHNKYGVNSRHLRHIECHRDKLKNKSVRLIFLRRRSIRIRDAAMDVAAGREKA